MIDVSGLGLGVYQGSVEKVLGPRQHYIDFGKVGQHTAVLKVTQQRFRGRYVRRTSIFQYRPVVIPSDYVLKHLHPHDVLMC